MKDDDGGHFVAVGGFADEGVWFGFDAEVV